MTAIGTICDCCPSHSLSRSQSDIPLPQLWIISLFIGGVLRALCLCAIRTRILCNTRQREATQTAETMERARQINNNQSMRETRSRNNSSAPPLFSNPLSCSVLCVSPVLLGPRKHKTPSPPALNDWCCCWLRLLPSSPLLLQWRWFVQLSCRVNYWLDTTRFVQQCVQRTHMDSQSAREKCIPITLALLSSNKTHKVIMYKSPIICNFSSKEKPMR